MTKTMTYGLNDLYRNGAKISLYVADIEAYVNGRVKGLWISLPLEERVLDEVLSMAEEVAIHDYECDFMRISEYANIRELNEIAQKLELLNEEDLEVVQAHMSEFYSNIEEAIECLENHDFSIYRNCSSMTEVAMEYVEMVGAENCHNDYYYIDEDDYIFSCECNGEMQLELCELTNEQLRLHFDYESYGEDMKHYNTFVFTNNGNCIEFFI